MKSSGATLRASILLLLFIFVGTVFPQTDGVAFKTVWNEADLDGYRSCLDQVGVHIIVAGPPTSFGTPFTLNVHRGYGDIVASAEGLKMPFSVNDTQTPIPCGPYEPGQFYRFSIEYENDGEPVTRFDDKMLIIWGAGSFRFQDSTSTPQLRRQVREGFRARQVRAYLDWQRFVGPEQFRFVLHDPVGGEPGRNTYYFCDGGIPCGGQYQPAWQAGGRPQAVINIVKDVVKDRTYWISYHEAGHAIAQKLGLPFWAEVGHIEFEPFEREAVVLCEYNK